MNLLNLTFDVPAAILEGLRSGELFRDGAIIRRSGGTMPIVAWLRETASDVDQWMRDGASQRILDQLASVGQMVSQLEILSAANLVASAITFDQMERQFARIDARLDRIDERLMAASVKLDRLIEFIKSGKRAQFRGALVAARIAALNGRDQVLNNLLAAAVEVEQTFLTSAEELVVFPTKGPPPALLAPSELVQLLDTALIATRLVGLLMLSLGGRREALDYVGGVRRRVRQAARRLRQMFDDEEMLIRSAALAERWPALMEALPALRTRNSALELQIAVLEALPERTMEPLFSDPGGEHPLQLVVFDRRLAA